MVVVEPFGKGFAFLGKRYRGSRLCTFLLSYLELVSFVNCRNSHKQKERKIERL